MGWPVPCFPKEEQKMGNSWGQRGTIWRNPSAPSCWLFPTSVAMERMRQEGRVVPASALGMGGCCHSPRPAHAPSWLRDITVVSCQEVCQWHRSHGTKVTSCQGCCCPIRAMLVPSCLWLSILVQKSTISLHGAGSDPQHPSKLVLCLHSHSETQ